MSTLEYSESLRALGRSSWKNVHNCKLCPYFTTSLFLMVNHVRRHRLSQEKYTCENAKIEVYLCKDCDFKTELTILFKQHINKNHSFKSESRDDLSIEDFSVRNYVCEKCDLETNLSLKWLQHTSECTGKKENLQSMSSVKENTTHKGWYYCALCSYTSRDNGNFKRHLRKHALNKQYACDKCPFKTKWKGNLSIHIKRTHLDERDVEWHKCEKCPYKTTKKSHVTRHITNVHLKEEEGKWYQCNECPYKSRMKSNLKIHVISKHLDEEKITWYKCEQCQFKTRQKGSLRKHINIHIKKQKCSFKTVNSFNSNNEDVKSKQKK
ncbi:hypothetical protein Zmor_016690 [Zophobas morio]|uniref:Protein hunchback n=1 Tax=Zophobas morio TaxID=2755281 RepID=A0AA38MC55_9CUCU|nr:hypothetical protein Zmor_003701 [Zophobas morio]KAJ3650602.1 hypothetical protein Zmor_016690 [Zophobas morio]